MVLVGHNVNFGQYNKRKRKGDAYCDIEAYLCFLQRSVLRLSILRGNIQGPIARDIQGGENRMSNEKHFEKATLLFDQILTTLKPPPKKCLKR